MYVQILAVYFFLQLTNLLGHSSEFHFEFSNLFLCFQQILAIQVPVTPHSFI